MSVEVPEPEFSHKVPLSEIGGKAVVYHLDADRDQLLALAKRFELSSLESLKATATLSAEDNGIFARGQISAALSQACVVSGAPVPANIAESFAIRFVTEQAYDPDVEIELATEDCDILFHDGRAIDLGEVVAQTLALSIDPFPRSTAAEDVLKEAGVKGEQDVGPFAALAALRKSGD